MIDLESLTIDTLPSVEEVELYSLQQTAANMEKSRLLTESLSLQREQVIAAIQEKARVRVVTANGQQNIDPQSSE